MWTYDSFLLWDRRHIESKEASVEHFPKGIELPETSEDINFSDVITSFD